MRGGRLMWSVMGASVLVVALLLAYLNAQGSTEHPSMSEPPTPAAPEVVCARDLAPLTDSACFSTPPSPAESTPLIVYLHGRFAPAALAEELDRQSRVARLASSRGYAVVAVRGSQGECTSEDTKDWYCWPSNERNADDAPRFVATKLVPAIAAARQRLGPGPNVLLGFSNGGYFANLIAKRSLLPFDAVVVAHGGPIQVETQGPMPPMLLITADEDPSDPEMRRLDGELTRASWPHALISRDGNHGLPDWDIDSALTFFTRARMEKLPLSPPLANRSRPAVPEAGEEDVVEPATTEIDP